MRIVLVHPNYQSGGAEIAGNWPPAWVAYLAGHLKDAGFTDIHFIDAMTNDLSDEDLAARLKELKPDVVGSTAITPSIYKAERVLEIAKEVAPAHSRAWRHSRHLHVQAGSFGSPLGRCHRPRRGRGNLPRTHPYRRRGALARGKGFYQGPRLHRRRRQDRRHPGSPHGQGSRCDQSRLDISGMEQVHLCAARRTRVAIPNMARGCPFTCSFCSQWKFWRDYRVRDPKKVVDEIENLVNNHQVGFFILADEEPTINRKKFIQFCEELIARGLPDKVKWGINTRVTDIMRDKEL
jgi:anaerobic magnesium-protoporphyrin IX monomethyl ester cyclase